MGDQVNTEVAKRAMLITELVRREPEAITRSIAMMAYNPSIGRVLEHGGVNLFGNLMVEIIPRFYGLVSRAHFDTVHTETCERILASFKTNKGKRLSYGQAQKPLNVFLKVYVDWAKLPTHELADVLAPLLHVPLDSLLMGFIKRTYSDEYERRICSIRNLLRDRIAERLQMPGARGAARQLLGAELALTAVNKEIYLAWQDLLRSIYPGKPVLLDVIWALERARVRRGAPAEERGVHGV